MENKKTLDSDYFEQVYAANDDPWNFQTSGYEAEKYAATIQALPKKKYGNALEIGCSIGVLTQQLAEICSRLLATDVSEKALERAREMCRDLPNVDFKAMSFPHHLPQEKYDLIVVSEVAYYLSPEDWKLAIGKMFEILNEKGEIIGIHSMHSATSDMKFAIPINYFKDIFEKLKNGYQRDEYRSGKNNTEFVKD